MLNKYCKSLLWLTLPVALAAGCVHEQREADFTAWTPAVTPTSEGGPQRVYAEGSMPEGIIGPGIAAPTGAAVTDWSLGEEIRGRLMSDRSLAPRPSGVTATVEKGTKGLVTLRGTVPTERDRKKLHDSIASLPGVEQIDDQVQIGRRVGQFENDIRGAGP